MKDGRILRRLDNFMNFVDGLELKMTPNKGRGLFASRNLKKAELLIAEKAIATGTENVKVDKTMQISYSPSNKLIYNYNQTDLIRKCSDICQIKGV